jgi:soluble lytic murein transglycosylase-like protein
MTRERLSALASLLLFVAGSVFGQPVDRVDRVGDYIRSFRAGMNTPKTDELVVGLAGEIVSVSERYNLDPTLVSIIIATESSFHKEAEGNLGEIGLMQVMPRFFDKGDNTTDVRVQLDAGCRHLRACLNECGEDIYKSLSRYAGNTCDTPSPKAAYKYNLYRKELKKWKESKK